MGFRASAITEHTGVTIPQWFKDKWDKQLNIPIYEGDYVMQKRLGQPRTPISYKYERKWHDDVIEDLQKVVAEDTEWSGEKLQMVIMHENGEVNRVNIYRDKIVIEYASDWEIVDELRSY